MTGTETAAKIIKETIEDKYFSQAQVSGDDQRAFCKR
jgi:hypothetical protein